jgi:transcriptional regulator with XRE-family HTH domain
MTLSDRTLLHDEDMLDSLTIGRRLREIRTGQGMTLEELGTLIGRAASQISVIENGKREAKLSELQALAGRAGGSSRTRSTWPPLRVARPAAIAGAQVAE